MREGGNRLREGVNRLRNGGTCSRDSARHLQGKNEYQKLSGNRLGVGDFRIFFFFVPGKTITAKIPTRTGLCSFPIFLAIKNQPVPGGKPETDNYL